jgi:ferric-dicitrate binding protein FerR (iron transport regulator)
MRSVFPILLVLFVLGPAATTPGQTQDPDRVLLKGFLVEGGRVNLIEGDVRHINGDNSVGALTSNQTLENGEIIESGPTGRAEILLLPGYYLRLDHNTRISLLDLSAGNLKLKLWNGSAILEVPGYEIVTLMERIKRWQELSYEPVSLLTPGAEYLAAGGGCYRLSVTAKGDSELRVVKGVAFVNGRHIDAGKSLSIAQEQMVTPAASKLEDEFERWSRQRAKGLVKANQSLSKTGWYKRVRSDRAYVLITDPEDVTRAKERLTVSADTGVVVLVDNAIVSESEAGDWRKLQRDDRLKNGNRVRTAAESRAEIHVYPSCFLYLEGDTEIVYRDTEGRVEVELLKGSAIVIVDHNPEGAEPVLLTIVADKVKHTISEKGNYRVNVMGGTKPELLIYEGTTRVPTSKKSKKNRSANTIEEETPLKDLTGDSFDVWSYRRSKLPMIRGFGRYFGPIGGMWYLLESTGEYTFVPGRYQYSSPYGGTYSIRFARDTLLEKPRPNPARDPLDPIFRPIRP